MDKSVVELRQYCKENSFKRLFEFKKARSDQVHSKKPYLEKDF